MLRKHLLFTTLLSVCIVAASTAQETAPDAATDLATLHRNAYAAYESKDYVEGAKYFALAAAAASGVTAANGYYNAGCCQALAGGMIEPRVVLVVGVLGEAFRGISNRNSTRLAC